MKSFLQRIHQSAAVWSFFATLLRVGANLFVLPLVLRKLPSDQLGVWYIFGTIGGLASLLDFGFEPTISRMTSYAWGGATQFVTFGIHRDDTASENREPNLRLLRDLIATLKAYYFYAGAGVLLLLTVGGGGWIWLKTEGLAAAPTLRLAWLVYAAGCCLNFVVGRWPALLTGVGAVREAQRVTIISQMFYYVFVITGLLAGLNVIWVLVGGFLVMGFVARNQGKVLFKKIAPLPGGLPAMHFHREIFRAVWPNAWRTGAVGVGSFLTVQANTLICSAFLSLATTAAFALSFQLVNILFGLCSVWVAVKLPAINTLRVQGRNDAIASLFARRMRLTLVSYVAGSLVIIFAAPLVLHWLGSKTPLISTGQLAVLVLIRLLELHQSVYCFLVLTENHNPFLKPSLISGAAIVMVSILLTPLYGVWGLLISMGLVQLCYNDWWPVLRALRGLGLKPGEYFPHQYLRPRAWLELF